MGFLRCRLFVCCLYCVVEVVNKYLVFFCIWLGMSKEYLVKYLFLLVCVELVVLLSFDICGECFLRDYICCLFLLCLILYLSSVYILLKWWYLIWFVFVGYVVLFCDC